MSDKTKAPRKKLLLHRETLKVLTSDQLKVVAGGQPTDGPSRPGTNWYTCTCLTQDG